MSTSLLTWFLLATAIFWSVGVYNRLMRIRAQGLIALADLELQLQGYANLLRMHIAKCGATTLQATEAAEGWSFIFELMSRLELVLSRDRGSTAPLRMSQVTDAINLMQMAWADQKQRPVDLGGQRIPDDLAAQWDAVTYQVQIAIANFNHIMVKYNQAITQFPARLVVGLFGFRAAGTM